MPDALMLRWPTLDEEDEFLRAHRATTPESPTFLHGYQEGMSLARYLETLAERERGVNLPPNHVPSTFLFAFKGPRIVGRVTIRHALNDTLARVGGHKNGGVLEEIVSGPDLDTPKRRYWIDSRRSGA
jgi:predicted acetyltransferase